MTQKFSFSNLNRVLYNSFDKLNEIEEYQLSLKQCEFFSLLSEFLVVVIQEFCHHENVM